MLDIHHQLYINAPCSKVFVAISSQHGLSKWWGDTKDLRTDFGAMIPFMSNDQSVQTLKIVDAKIAEYLIWKCVAGSDHWLGTEIMFQLKPEGKGTKLCFKHSGWSKSDDNYAAVNFLWSRKLIFLKALCETGKIAPDYLQELKDN